MTDQLTHYNGGRADGRLHDRLAEKHSSAVASLARCRDGYSLHSRLRCALGRLFAVVYAHLSDMRLSAAPAPMVGSDPDKDFFDRPRRGIRPSPPVVAYGPILASGMQSCVPITR